MRNKIAVELPNDCLPNINDLRQIFDDSQAGLRSSHNGSDAAMHHAASVKRSSHTERTLLQQQQSSAAASAAAAAAAAAAFFDAKPTHLEENIFESKSRNLEFERAKQKFDNPHGQHHHHHQRQRSGNGRYGSAGSSASRANLALPLKGTTNGGSSSVSSKDELNRQLYEKEQSAGAGYARNSINLDGLKVSDDEVRLEEQKRLLSHE